MSWYYNGKEMPFRDAIDCMMDAAKEKQMAEIVTGDNKGARAKIREIEEFLKATSPYSTTPYKIWKGVKDIIEQ